MEKDDFWAGTFTFTFSRISIGKIFSLNKSRLINFHNLLATLGPINIYMANIWCFLGCIKDIRMYVCVIMCVFIYIHTYIYVYFSNKDTYVYMLPVKISIKT